MTVPNPLYYYSYRLLFGWQYACPVVSPPGVNENVTFISVKNYFYVLKMVKTRDFRLEVFEGNSFFRIVGICTML
jgi:hypothetical protein